MFRIYCTNKGCSKESEALLNTETDEVECAECGKSINVPYSTKASLKSIGQIRRTKKSEKAFSVECKKCNKIEVPVIDANKNIVCGKCKVKLDNISAPFANLIREKLKNG